MSARTLSLVIALALSACGPATAPETIVQDDPSDPYVIALASTPVSGAWTFRDDNGTVSACFSGTETGSTEAECRLSISCNAPTGAVTVRYAYALAPDQETVLRIFNTPALALDLSARSSNADAPSVTAELAGLGGASHQPLVDTLAPRQVRFAVQVGDDITIFPWDESIARTLAACP